MNPPINHDAETSETDANEADETHANSDNSDTETTVSENTEFSYDDDNDDDYDDDDNNYSYNYNANFQLTLSNNYTNKNILLIPEIYNKYFHGRTTDSDPNIDGQFLVLQSFYINSNNNIFEFFKYINNLTKFYKKYYERNFCDLYFPHTLLRNYNNIIKHPKYLNLEIGKFYYLRGSECVCVIKTFWLKLVQLAWKKIHKIRQQILKRRCLPDSIMYRQICGKWPQNCNYMPSIRGMLL
jgi:hypothetical protein